MSAPIASDRPSALAIAASPTTSANDGEQEELARQPVEHAVDQPGQQRDAASDSRDEDERLRDERERLARPAPPLAAIAMTNAITMSSKRSTPSTTSVSSSARRRKSMRPLTATALDET